MSSLDLIVAGACVLLAQAGARLWRNREAPGAVPCLGFIAAVAVYVVPVALAEPAVWTVQVGYLASVLIAPALFVAAVEYAGLRIPYWREWRYALPALVSVLALDNVWSLDPQRFAAIAAEGDLLGRSAAINAIRHGPLLSTTLTSYALAIATLAVAVRRSLESPAQRRDMALLAALLCIVAGADVVNLLTGFTIGGRMPTPLALLAGVLLATLLLHRSTLFDARPVARSVLIDCVHDAIVVVDRRRVIVDCNATAMTLPGHNGRGLLGSHADSVLPREFAALLQSSVHLRSELAVRADGRELWFEVDVAPLTPRGHNVGHLIVARDISERRAAQNALEESRRSLEQANAQLVEQSVTDPLTGLKNRRFLFQRLNEEMNRHHRSGAVLGLLALDLDHFKSVNDTHGHPVGDEALVQVARTLADTVRDCDVVARMGGEEFAILAVNTDADGLLNLAERVRQAICSTPVARNTPQPMTLTASIGVAFAGPHTRSPDGLFEEADHYLYRAKNRGRNRVVAGVFEALNAPSPAEPAAAPRL